MNVAEKVLEELLNGPTLYQGKMSTLRITSVDETYGGKTFL